MVGSGFNAAELEEITGRLKELKVKSPASLWPERPPGLNGKNSGYEMDMGIFQGLDKFPVIADANTPSFMRERLSKSIQDNP